MKILLILIKMSLAPQEIYKSFDLCPDPHGIETNLTQGFVFGADKKPPTIL